MNHHAEYVFREHPDRLADAIAESIVTAAVRHKPDGLVGVEVAVQTDCVFFDRRIAAGFQPLEIERSFAMFTAPPATVGQWKPDPEKRIDWRHLVLGVQHTPKLPYERQHQSSCPSSRS